MLLLLRFALSKKLYEQNYKQTKPNYRMSKHHGETLETVLNKRGISIINFGKEYFGLTHSAAYKIPKREKLSHSQILLSCFLLKISPKIFGLPENLMVLEGTPISKNMLPKLQFISAKHHHGKSDTEFIEENYFGAIKRCMPKETTKYVKVFDCFATNKKNSPNEVYHEAHKNYFKHIETILAEKKDFKYQRIMAMPINLPEKDLEKDLAQLIVLYAFPETLYHAYFVLTKYKEKCKIVVTRFPSRSYSYMVIDGGYNQHFIAEHDFLFASGNSIMSKSDTVFIDTTDVNSVNDPIKDVIKTYEKEFDDQTTKCVGSACIELTALQIKIAIETLIKQLENEKQKLIEVNKSDTNTLQQLRKYEEDIKNVQSKQKMLKEKFDIQF